MQTTFHIAKWRQMLKRSGMPLEARLGRFLPQAVPYPIKIKIVAFNISRRWLAHFLISTYLFILLYIASLCVVNYQRKII